THAVLEYRVNSELYISIIYAFSYIGKPLGQVVNKSSESFEIIIFGCQLTFQKIFHIIEVNLGIKNIHSAPKAGIKLFFRIIIVIHNIAHNLFQNIIEGDKPFCATVFIYHDGNMGSLLLEITQQVIQFLSSRNKECFTRNGAPVNGGTLDIGVDIGQHIFGVDDSQDIVQIVLINRHPRYAFAPDKREHLIQRVSSRDSHNINARSHNFAHADITKLDNILDNFALITFY